MPNSMTEISDAQAPIRNPLTPSYTCEAALICRLQNGMIEISSSLHAFNCLQPQINPYSEELWILALNAQLQLIKKEMLFRGTADHCLVHPRDIFRSLVLCNASSFIMAHNHPSEQVLPSKEDLILTQKIFFLARLFEIPLNDHLVMSKSKYYSMADHNEFRKWKMKKTGPLSNWASA